MPVLAALVFCTTLHNAATGGDLCFARTAARVQPSPMIPALTIDATQREAVRAAAAPYRGSSIRIVLYGATRQYTAFARGLAQALEAAGLNVATEMVERFDLPDCAHRPGLRIMYGIARSGAVNAIAEALIRSRIVTESVSGCSVGRQDEFTFILSAAAVLRDSTRLTFPPAAGESPGR